MTAAVLWYSPLALLSKTDATTATPCLLASAWKASVVGPGTLSASLKFSWSSLWQKYLERKSSCVQMMFAPRRAAFPARASVFPRLAAGSTEQACWRSPRVSLPISVDDLVERVLDDALGAERLQLRQDLAHDALVDDRLEGDPLGAAERRDRRIAQGRDRRDDGPERLLVRVHLEADLRLRLQGPADKQRDRLDLRALHRVRPRLLVGDQLRVRLKKGVNDPQLVGAQRRARLRYVHDGVDQVGHLHLGRAPRELDLRRDSLGREIALDGLDELRRDPLSREVRGHPHGGVLGHAKNPARLVYGGAAVDEVADLDDVRPVLLDPVEAREAAVEEPVLDVAAHLLRADETAVQLRIVYGRPVGARIARDLPPRLREKAARGVLQAALGQAQHQNRLLVRHRAPSCRLSTGPFKQNARGSH